MTATLDWLAFSPAALIIVTALFGLLVGSFLNVVIHRLPQMMERRWQAECAELRNEEQPKELEQPFNLVTPRSCCPSCGHAIGALENIPVISYLLQAGKCRGCGTGISAQYPAIEILTAILSGIAAWYFGYGWPLLFALILTWALVALSAIDFKTQLLPDQITLPLLWLGLIANINGLFTDLTSAVLGAIFGYLILWSIYHLFRLLTGKEGMGYGDFKLLAALGAWFGWQLLPITILLSSVAGALIGGALILINKNRQGVPMPFGPFLAIAGWIAMLWGGFITDAYMRLSGL